MYDDEERCLQRYHAFGRQRPELFENPPACPTNILLEAEQIERARSYVRLEREAAGFPTADLRVGLLAEDHYIGHIVRDAVRFSDGSLGLYNRIISTGGVVVLPILNEGIALIRIFRHAPRRWMLEAPQGLVLPDADPIEEARRELLEEMEAPADALWALGKVYTSTAMTSESLHVVAARITQIGTPQRSEGIDSVRFIPKPYIDSLLLDGTICDGPTTTAITRSRLRGLL
jgi:ADP-ribose pyrophosphatase